MFPTENEIILNFYINVTLYIIVLNNYIRICDCKRYIKYGYKQMIQVSSFFNVNVVLNSLPSLYFVRLFE